MRCCSVICSRNGLDVILPPVLVQNEWPSTDVLGPSSHYVESYTPYNFSWDGNFQNNVRSVLIKYTEFALIAIFRPNVILNIPISMTSAQKLLIARILRISFMLKKVPLRLVKYFAPRWRNKYYKGCNNIFYIFYYTVYIILYKLYSII